MSEYISILPIAAIAIYGGVYLLRHSDTRIGERIRASDHDAWRDAVREREEELRELRAQEPHA